MNQKEKAAQALKTSDFISTRVGSFIERNIRVYRKTKKDSILFKKTFHSKDFGEWEVEIDCIIDHRSYGVHYNFVAFQKYFVSRAKELDNNGIGFYMICSGTDNILFDLPPHVINRFRERFYRDTEDDVTVERIRHDIYNEVAFSNTELTSYVPKSIEDEQKILRYLGRDAEGNKAIIVHTLSGEFLGNIYISDNSNEDSDRYVCLTTYVDNEDLKNEQIAHTVAVSSSQANTDAKKVIRQATRKGHGRDELIDKKKESIISSTFLKDKNDLMEFIHSQEKINSLTKSIANSIKKISRLKF